jgi:cytochrome c553
MMDAMRASLATLLVVLGSLSTSAQDARQRAASLPEAATRTIDFGRDVQPILVTSCVRCHARGKAKGGFSIETRDALLKGGDNGPAVLPGNSEASELIALVAGLDPENVMPQKGSRLTPAQIATLRAWIDQGVPWQSGVTFARADPRNLVPRRPAVPAASSQLVNPIDRLLQPYFAKAGIDPGPPADDRVLVRRLYLDVTGLLPPPKAVQAFVADRRPNKRALLVSRLLADRVGYAEHWLSFWNDLLRNDYRGPGYIDGGRQQITAWLYAALVQNLPYDQFVAELVDPVPASEGFSKGIIWRGVVNASQTPQMQAAQNISQVFMGVNLKCASCHDSFINDWQLADAYGMAGIYADAPLQMVECDRPTGETAPVKFLYAGLGSIDPLATRAERLKQLAAVITSASNGRLPRTLVNRIWARLMGRGLVEPVDDMEREAWHPDLLDWLAEDFVANGFDVKKTIERILTSRAYQRAAADLPDRREDYVFRGPAVRRMTAEQFADALGTITGVWQEAPAGDFDFTILDDRTWTAWRARWSLVPSHIAPRPFTDAVARRIAVTSRHARVRASLAASDSLMTALGRPTREQVVTTRVAPATTLQALELLNGQTLARSLRSGAERLTAIPPSTPALLVDRIYLRALGRRPNQGEMNVCLEMLGGRLETGGVEDLLWSVAMLPEFQLIY